MADNETERTVRNVPISVSAWHGRYRMFGAALAISFIAIGFGAAGLLAPPRAAQPVPRRSEPSIFMPTPQQLSALTIEPVTLMVFWRGSLSEQPVELDAGDGFLAPAVPESAIVDDGEAPRVWVTTAGGGLVLREIQTGRIDGDMVEVRQGLRAGERIVVRGTLFLDGAINHR